MANYQKNTKVLDKFEERSVFAAHYAVDDQATPVGFGSLYQATNEVSFELV